MREIKFRYLRVDGEGWLIGDLSHHNEQTLIIPKWDYPNQWDNTDMNIICESVGQFTGLKDKNGVDIYEGDIVAGFDNGIKIGNPDVIVFENGRFKLDKTPEDLIHWVSNFSYRSLKVIGSIHSNVELLK